jgi:phosphate-selective porin OprO/OprP
MRLRQTLLASSAALLLASPALADDAAIEKRLDAMQHMIEAQQQQIESQKSEIGALRHAIARKGVRIGPTESASTAPPSSKPLEARVDEQQRQIDLAMEKIEAQETEARVAKADAPVISMAGGRPTIASADGRFSLAIRALGQFDIGYYVQGRHAMQLATANGPDLSSGSNFRRAQLGIQGKLFGDWSYYFNYEFGSGISSGNELQGRIQQAFIEYDGIAPWNFRVGAFPPSAGLEDSTGSADAIFLERNSPSDVVRNLAGGDGRDAVAVTYAGDELYGSVALTGGKVADTNLYFDEQQAVVARAAATVYSDNDARIVLSATGMDVFRGPDATAGAGSARNITLQDPPELTVDDQSIKLVSTGALNAENAWAWGAETAAQWSNLYGQAGYFGYGIDPRTAGARTLSFDGWYAQATFVLTGESKGYNASTAAFTSPKPRVPFSLDGWGPGAWEIAARYSDLNLNDRAGMLGAALPSGGIRGGEQQIATVAINWYPISTLKFALQFQNVDISRIGTIPAGFGHGVLNNAEVGQRYNTLAFRSQISF